MKHTRQILTGAAALVALSGCTAARQIAAVVSESPTEQPSAASAVVTATVDCHDFTFELSGYPAGSRAIVGVGAQPPFGFHMVDGTATGHVSIPVPENALQFNAIIDIITGTSDTRVFDQMVDCTG